MSLDFNKVNQNGMKDYLEYVNSFIDYYNKVIYKNKSLLNALAIYKQGVYMDLFNLFNKSSNNMTLNLPLKSLLNGIKKTKNELEKLNELKNIELVKELNKIKEEIKNNLIKDKFIEMEINRLKRDIKNLKYLDMIIYNAPKTKKDMCVFRTMNDIIHSFDKCENEELVYTFPNYISTALTLSVPYKWLGNKRFESFEPNKALYKIKIPKGTMSIALPWSIDNQTKFEDNLIDTQSEMLLPRNCKFKLISSQYIYFKNENDLLFGDNYRISEIPCIKKHKYKVRFYTLELIEQATLEDLKKDYSHFNKKIKNLKYELII